MSTPKLSPGAIRKRRWRARLKAMRDAGDGSRDAAPRDAAMDVAEDAGERSGLTLLERLTKLAEDESATGQARVSAARAVLEAQGVLGKHARVPGDGDAVVPPGLLTRAGLERELARLRRSVLLRNPPLSD